MFLLHKNREKLQKRVHRPLLFAFIALSLLLIHIPALFAQPYVFFASATESSLKENFSFSFKQNVDTAYSSITAEGLTERLSHPLDAPFSFGICNTQIEDAKTLSIQRIDIEKVVTFEGVEDSLFAAKKQISIPLNEILYSPAESELNFLEMSEDSLGGGLIAVYDVIPYRGLGRRSETIKYTVPTYDPSPYQYPTEREGYKQRQSEQAPTYDSWRTPQLVYLKSPQPTADLGPSHDLKSIRSNLGEGGLIVRVLKWVYYDIPWMVVNVFAEKPTYVFGILLFCSLIFGLLGLFLLCQLTRRIK